MMIQMMDFFIFLLRWWRKSRRSSCLIESRLPGRRSCKMMSVLSWRWRWWWIIIRLVDTFVILTLAMMTAMTSSFSSWRSPPRSPPRPPPGPAWLSFRTSSPPCSPRFELLSQNFVNISKHLKTSQNISTHLNPSQNISTHLKISQNISTHLNPSQNTSKHP